MPESVSLKIENGSLIFKGPKGEVRKNLPGEVEVKNENGSLFLSGKGEGKNKKADLGTAAALIKSAIAGVKDGYEKKLELEGVGYKVQQDGANLVLSLGFTHKINIVPPKDISFKVEKNVITVSGIDKELVGQVSAEIRDKKLPEPYKGKGIHYTGEVIRRKAGKKAVSSA